MAKVGVRNAVLPSGAMDFDGTALSYYENGGPKFPQYEPTRRIRGTGPAVAQRGGAGQRRRRAWSCVVRRAASAVSPFLRLVPANQLAAKGEE